MNLGEIRNTYSNIMVEGMLKKDSKLINTFKAYIRILKENKDLSEAGIVYHNLERESIADEAEAKLFVEMNINHLASLNKTKIYSGLKELSKILEGIKVVPTYSPKDAELHKSIVITSNKSINTFKESINATKILVERVINNKPITKVNEDFVPTETLSELVVEKFNLKYRDLSETDKELVKLMSEGSEVKMEGSITNTMKECVTLINTQLKEADLETKSKLLDVKEKLLETKYKQDTFLEDYTKLNSLKDSLV